MNKKWLYVLVGLLLLTIIISIGGKVYMDNRENQKEADMIEAERLSVQALKNTFADIQAVEFDKSSYNNITGYYSMNVKMTNREEESVQFSFMFTTNQPDEIDGWVVKDKKNVQKEGETTDEVKVIFSNGSKGEI